MDEKITCILKLIEGGDEHDAIALVRNLEKDGYTVSCNRSDNNGIFLRVSFSEKEKEKLHARNAGRKTKMTEKNCREVFLYRQDHTQKETAEMLKVNFRTYQRMEKSVKDAGFWEDSQTAEDTVFMRRDAKF